MLGRSIPSLCGNCLLLLTLVSADCAGSCTLSASPSGCPFAVRATIQAGCQITGGGGTTQFGRLDFGARPALSKATVTTALVASSSYRLNCTPNMSLTMTVDGGLHYNNGRRVELSSGNSLIYQIFSDMAQQNPIPVNQGVAIPNVGTGANITLPVYGRITLPGNAAAGAYSDTLLVTLSW